MAIDLDYVQDELREMSGDEIVTRDDHNYEFSIIQLQDRMKRDFEWFRSKEGKEEVAKYRGKWVFISSKRIVGSGTILNEAEDKAIKNGVYPTTAIHGYVEGECITLSF